MSRMKCQALTITEVKMTSDIDLCVAATILRKLHNSSMITQREAEKILKQVAVQIKTAPTCVSSCAVNHYFSSLYPCIFYTDHWFFNSGFPIL